MGNRVGTDYVSRITGPNGTALYVGGIVMGLPLDVYLVGTLNAGEVVTGNGTTSTIPRPDYVSTDTPVKQLLVGARGGASDAATLGVMMTTWGATGVYPVAGIGSIMAVKATANGTVGQYCNRAANGQVTPGATVTAKQCSGVVLKPGNLTGGSGTMVGMLVNSL